MYDIQNTSRISPNSYLRGHWPASYEIPWVHFCTIESNSEWMLAIEIQNLYKTIWMGLGARFINFQYVTKTNPRQQSNNATQHIITLEVNSSNKPKEPYYQVKCLSKCSILHWNHIHPHQHIYPCFQVISLTIIEILHCIRWFTRRNQKWVTVTLVGCFP